MAKSKGKKRSRRTLGASAEAHMDVARERLKSADQTISAAAQTALRGSCSRAVLMLVAGAAELGHAKAHDLSAGTADEGFKRDMTTTQKKLTKVSAAIVKHCVLV